MKIAFFKALIVLIPTYIVAFLTEKMVYVVPMLAASGFFAASLETSSSNIFRNLDDDGGLDSDNNTSHETDAIDTDQN